MGTEDGTEQGPAGDEPPSVFVSYSRTDQKAALPVVHALEQAGYSVWWDGMLEGGERYLNTTEAALENAKAVVVLWSGKSVTSHWVHDEAMRGRDRNCLIPLTIDGSEPPLGFRQFQTIDFSHHGRKARAEALDAVVRAVGALVKGTRSGPAVDSWRSAQTRVASFHRAVPLWAWLVAALVLIGAGGWWLMRPAPMTPMTLSVGRFEEIGPNVPGGLSQSIDSEIRSALAEDRVALIAGSADLVLTGTLRRVEADRVRFSVRIDAADGTMLWSDTDDLPVSDPEATRQFSRHTSRTVDCTLSAAARHESALPTATLALAFQSCTAKVNNDGGRLLVSARRLIRDAPDFWLGWHHLGYAVAQKELGGISDPALLAEAAAAGERLIALQPEYAEGYTIAAQALPPGRARERETLLRRAVQARPEECACSLQLLGDFLLQVGRIEEALAIFQRAVDQNANAPLPNLRLAIANYLMNRARAGDEAMRRFHATAGADWTPPDPALWSGRWSEAARFLRAPRPDEQSALIEALAALESRDSARIGRARASLERLPAKADTEPLVVPILAALGSTDSVMARLEDSRRRGSHYAAPGRHPGTTRPLLFDPLLRPIWSDPRFPAFLQRAGFIAYWRESRTRPDVCRAAGAPPFCNLLR